MCCKVRLIQCLRCNPLKEKLMRRHALKMGVAAFFVAGAVFTLLAGLSHAGGAFRGLFFLCVDLD